MVKKILRSGLRRLGYRVERNREKRTNTFVPYVHAVRLCGVSFDFWIADETGRVWYTDAKHRSFAENRETAGLIERADRVLEIGAHHGFLSIFLAKLVGPQGSVVAVEASPYNAMIASAQVSLNRAQNCRVVHAAAADKMGPVAISRESNAHIAATPESIVVQGRTVDALDEEFGPFNVVKIDVEGYEGHVLRGARRLLARQPKILLELHTPYLAPYQTSAEDIMSLIGPGYYGTFTPRSAREETSSYSFEALPHDIVNLFLAPFPCPIGGWRIWREMKDEAISR